MGLDMNLYRKTYVKRWDHIPAEKQFSVSVKMGNKKYENIDSDKISYIEEEIAYWRKANQIHQWFVDNVQDGEDNCANYYVSASQLEELVNRCKTIVEKCKLEPGKVKNGQRLGDNGWEDIIEDGEVMTNQALAEELLPTQSGFFFGGTGYDQWYMEDIKSTIEQLGPYVEKDEEGNYKNPGDFYYSSSW